MCSASAFGSGQIRLSTPEKVLIALCNQSIYQCVVLVPKSARTNKQTVQNHVLLYKYLGMTIPVFALMAFM